MRELSSKYIRQLLPLAYQDVEWLLKIASENGSEASVLVHAKSDSVSSKIVSQNRIVLEKQSESH